MMKDKNSKPKKLNVFKNSDGTYSIDVSLPSIGQQFRMIGNNPEYLFQSALEISESDESYTHVLNAYIDAVENLTRVALLQDGSGARAAAQLLLSAYDGWLYHLDLTDLCNLDTRNFSYAHRIIRGRYHTHREPHNIIENGQDIFDKIKTKWNHLRVDKRYEEYYYSASVL